MDEGARARYEDTLEIEDALLKIATMEAAEEEKKAKSANEEEFKSFSGHGTLIGGGENNCSSMLSNNPKRPAHSSQLLLLNDKEGDEEAEKLAYCNQSDDSDEGDFKKEQSPGLSEQIKAQ